MELVQLLRWPVVALVALGVGLRVFQLLWAQRVAIAQRERQNEANITKVNEHTERAFREVRKELDVILERVRLMDMRIPANPPIGARR